MIICLRCSIPIELSHDRYGWQCNCTIVKALKDEPNGYLLENEPGYWKSLEEIVQGYSSSLSHQQASDDGKPDQEG